MKKTVLFLLVTLLPAFVMAQKSSDDIYYVPPKKDHEAIKAAKDAENAQLYEQAIKALKTQKFILRTDKVEYRNGRSTTAPSYLSVNGEDVYLGCFFYFLPCHGDFIAKQLQKKLIMEYKQKRATK